MLTKPYRYQAQGIRAGVHFDGRILIGDEMGLGKTYQALGIFEKLLEPHATGVVVCPAILKTNWKSEALKHAGINAEVLEGRTPLRKTRLTQKHRLYIINYEILPFWVSFLRSMGVMFVAIDECHRIQNHNAKCTIAVRRLCRGVPYVAGLSGTPLTNRPIELFPILNLLRPDIWPSRNRFGHKHCGPKWTRWGIKFAGATRLKQLNGDLNRYCMVRRLKSEVAKDLPAKINSVVKLPIENRKEYEEAESDIIAWIAKQDMAKARRAANAKDLVRYSYLKQLAAKLKTAALTKWITSFLHESDEKILIFGVHRNLLRELHRTFRNSVLLWGGMTRNARDQRIDSFKRTSKRILFGQIRAMGIGLNLQVANHVAFAELPWTPGEVAQGADRAHRIGQKKTVFVSHLVAEETVEERLCKILQEKQEVVSKTLDGSTDVNALNILELLHATYTNGKVEKPVHRNSRKGRTRTR